MSELIVSTDLPYAEHPRQGLDAFFPQDLPAFGPLVVCVHDGWWQGGARSDMHPLCFTLAEAGFPAVALGGRRLVDLPEADGRELVADVELGVRRAHEEALLQGIECGATALLGSGSGAVLALLAGRRLDRDKSVAVHSAVPCGGLYAFGDLGACAPAVRQQARAFVGDHGRELDPERLDPYSFPPVLVLHGGADALVPPAQAEALHRRLAGTANGCRRETLPDAGHELLADPRGETGRRVLPLLTAWLSAPQGGDADADPPLRVGEPDFLRQE